MKAYKTLWDLLETDYDIEPSKETQELIVGIKQQAGDHPIPGAEPSLPLAPAAHAPGAAAAPSACLYPFAPSMSAACPRTGVTS
jgi:hypothetical protein